MKTSGLSLVPLFSSLILLGCITPASKNQKDFFTVTLNSIPSGAMVYSKNADGISGDFLGITPFTWNIGISIPHFIDGTPAHYLPSEILKPSSFLFESSSKGISWSQIRKIDHPKIASTLPIYYYDLLLNVLVVKENYSTISIANQIISSFGMADNKDVATVYPPQNIDLKIELQPIKTESVFSIDTQSHKIENSNLQKKIADLLSFGTQVRVLLIMPDRDVSVFCNEDRENDRQEKKIIKEHQIASYAALLSSIFSNKNNFQLVNRESISEILSEYEFQGNEITDIDNTVKLGKMVGANYIINFSSIRKCISDLVREEWLTTKLINIELNTIESVDIKYSYSEYDRNRKEWIVSKQKLNDISIELH
jgi:hypothetical protein